MIPFERRQRILSLLRERPGLKVGDLARALDVSEGTIRNDLNSLEKEGALTRVRGGAVPRESHRFVNATFAERAQINAEAKQQIARRAADMVEDGDSILLDASTTVFAMVPYLRSLRGLTVVTNGIEVGLALAQDPSHTVILVGGVLRPDGTSVVGHLGEKILEELHIKTAFVSCSGLTLDAGLTEIDIQEVQLKRRMIRSAERVVALVDSSKFGKVDFSLFATLDQIEHIYTDGDVALGFVEQLQRAGTALTVCGANTVSSFVPCREDNGHLKIGFANLGESMPFAVDVRRGLERAAGEAGNIDLILADNQLNSATALRVADELIAKSVDLAIEYQIDEKANSIIMDKFREANIPVIAVDIPMVGATYFGVNNYRAGHMAGAALGQSIRREWGGQIDHLIVLNEPRTGAVPAARIQGQLDGLEEVLGAIPRSKLSFADSGNTTEISDEQVSAELARLPGRRRVAIVSFNDDAALGAARAARRMGREQDVLIVGQGADRRVREEIRRPGSRIVGSTAYWPERYGPKLLEVACQLLAGEPVPPAVYNEHVFISRDNIDTYYPEAKDSLVPEMAGTAEVR